MVYGKYTPHSRFMQQRKPPFRPPPAQCEVPVSGKKVRKNSGKNRSGIDGADPALYFDSRKRRITDCDFAKIGRILIFLLGLYAVSAFCTFIQNFLMSGVSQKIAYGLRKQISEKLNHKYRSTVIANPHNDLWSIIP